MSLQHSKLYNSGGYDSLVGHGDAEEDDADDGAGQHNETGEQPLVGRMAVGMDHQVTVQAVGAHGQIRCRAATAAVVLHALADVLPDDKQDGHCNDGNRCAFRSFKLPLFQWLSVCTSTWLAIGQKTDSMTAVTRGCISEPLVSVRVPRTGYPACCVQAAFRLYCWLLSSYLIQKFPDRKYLYWDLKMVTPRVEFRYTLIHTQNPEQLSVNLRAKLEPRQVHNSPLFQCVQNPQQFEFLGQ